MRVYKLALICFSFLSLLGTGFAKDSTQTLQSNIEYRLEYDAEIPLRVTEIPSEFGMINKDLNGKVEPLKKGDELILENIYDIKVFEYLDKKKLPTSETVILKSGTKFYARVINSESAKSFNRDGFIELEFYKIETSLDDSAQRSLRLEKGELLIDNLAERESFSNKASKVAKTAGYSLGGALIAPLVTYKIIGLLTFSNPYVTAGAAATGAALGLAYGISSKGKNFNLEPGSELKLKLNSDWLLSRWTENSVTETKLNSVKIEPSTKAKLQVNKVKKSGSYFNQKCLKINLDYENLSEKSIRYISFRLVDSMNKEYLPENASLGELNNIGNLNLLYCVDYLKAIYTLELHSIDDYQLLASEKIILGK